MDVHEEVKNFIKAQQYKGAIDEKGSTAEQNYKRLNEAVNILEKNGITVPTEADFENILKPAITAKGKKAGTQAKDKTINRGLNLAKKFYHWSQSKGDFHMNDNEAITAEEELAALGPEFAGFAETMRLKRAIYEREAEKAKESSQPGDKEASKRERGKPVTTGRSEKLTLYLTPQTFNRLDDLRKYDEANLQDLLNEAIEVYFKSREDDMRFLQEQEEARRARKAQKAS